MALKALIFDMDGTLVDTNAAHAQAWQDAFRACGYEVPLDQLNAQIGKGGDTFVPAILGDEGEQKNGEALREGHTKNFIAILNAGPTRVFDGAHELIEHARQSGLKVALATSSKQEELQAIERSSGVIWSELFDLVTTGSEAERSKPAPDLVTITIEKLGFTPRNCALVGDTIYDAQSATSAGAIAIGVQSGPPQVSTDKLLREAGACATFASLEELLQRFDEIVQL